MLSYPSVIKIFFFVILISAAIFAEARKKSSAIIIPSEFCANPYQFVCGEHGQGLKNRARRIKQIKDQLAQTTFEIARRTDPTATGIRLARIYYSELRRQMQIYLKQSKLPSDINFKPIRQDFLKVLAGENMPADIKQKMIDIVKAVEVINPADLDLKDFIKNREVELENKHGCGKDGMNDNAFAVDLSNGKKTVMICPGAIVAAIEHAKAEGLTENHLVSGLVATLGHEIGHHIDNESFADHFSDLNSCVTKNYSEYLDKEPENYLREIIADMWGAKVLAEYIQREPSLKLREKIMRGAVDDLCEDDEDRDHDEIDDGEHPSGAFRIEEFVFKNAVIQDSFLCVQREKPLCEISSENKPGL